VAQLDDFARQVYCILGIPVDAIEMPALLSCIEAAAASRAPYVISTVNLNFLANSQSDSDFRESLLLSDLCTADGIAVVWIARLTGIPIKHRVAGSDIFDTLRASRNSSKPLKVLLFGGPEGAAAAASQALNAEQGGLHCVGSFYPGFCPVNEMSRDDIINQINSSGADFLVASLGAEKGQMWLLRNHHRLHIPVRAHLGAALNFQAGKVRRAPPVVRELGLEWLWRIKEEPYLWRRYWNDGCVLLRLFLTRVLPLVMLKSWLQLKHGRKERELVITLVHCHDSVTVSLSGSATAQHVDKVVPVFRDVVATDKRIIVDFSNTRAIDARFLGLLLVLRKQLNSRCGSPILIGLSHRLRRIFRLNGLGFLL
jgi:N-acetylglucosaminyldiphosphoundecaprenol N-acetyl-beta-D-mannosaminyltransferase